MGARRRFGGGGVEERARCLPRGGGLGAWALGLRGGWEGGSKRVTTEEVDEWERARLWERALASGAVLGRGFSCRWRWTGLSAGANCLAWWGGGRISERLPPEETDPWDWGRRFTSLVAPSVAPGHLFSCR